MNWNNLQRVLNEYQDYLDARAKSKMPDYWALKDKISFNLKIDNQIYSIEFNGPEYWKWAQYGRRPGKMPPVNVIRDWIIRRQILPDPNRGVPDINSLAFVIARKIGRDGTKGIDFYDSTINEAEVYFKDRISDAISNDIAAELESFLSPMFDIK